MTIILAGATGLVGGLVLPLLSDQGLHIITRRAVAHCPAAIVQSVGDPKGWAATIATTKPDIAISTLGTTIRAAGSQTAFRAIDFDLVCSVAEAARKAGARQFIMVSSVSASARSSGFYLKTKGAAEDAVRAMGFDRVDILRPGLLKGDRAGPVRPVEQLMIRLAPITDMLTPTVLSQYRSIDASSVAQAIAALCGHVEPGVHVHHNAEMLALARTIG